MFVVFMLNVCKLSPCAFVPALPLRTWAAGVETSAGNTMVQLSWWVPPNTPLSLCLSIIFLIDCLFYAPLPSFLLWPPSVGMDRQQRGADESWHAGCGPAVLLSWPARVAAGSFSCSDVRDAVCRFETAFVFCKTYYSLWAVVSDLYLEFLQGSVRGWCQLSLYVLIAHYGRKSYFLPESCCGFVCDSCTSHEWAISFEEKPQVAYQDQQTEATHWC